jgi:16S rRNA (guanine1207-N2)-methyltransferase
MAFRVSEQYFSREPSSRHDERELVTTLRGRDLRFVADAGVFSKDRIDRGTRLLVDALTLRPNDQVLDVGCGYGVLGIVAATLAPQGHVTLTDVNPRAVHLTRRNLRGNRIANAEVLEGAFFEPVGDRHFDAIVTNPPLRAGKGAVQRLLQEAVDHLQPGGRFWMVVRTSRVPWATERTSAPAMRRWRSPEKEEGTACWSDARVGSRPPARIK